MHTQQYVAFPTARTQCFSSIQPTPGQLSTSDSNPSLFDASRVPSQMGQPREACIATAESNQLRDGITPYTEPSPTRRHQHVTGSWLQKNPRLQKCDYRSVEDKPDERVSAEPGSLGSSVW